ncbi:MULTISPECIES: mycothiol transferase [unclassified Microbacterium]|uniref:mycothiol transferase n=1 Tax=unclassified Microbacterium TaxID=2609290 RepID=UPI00056B07F0|nr:MULTISPECIES: DUF664 domain-containing protein [unclassified Microbacterium]
MHHRHRDDHPFDLRRDVDRRLLEYRELILASLEGLTEEEARSAPIPGAPSLLGVVRHTAYVEGVWFDERITGRPRAEIGLPVATANSWKVRRTDDIASVTAECRRISALADSNLTDRGLDDEVGESRRSLLAIYVHVLSELGWNTGQLDILRAAILAARRRAAGPTERA